MRSTGENIKTTIIDKPKLELTKYIGTIFIAVITAIFTSLTAVDGRVVANEKETAIIKTQVELFMQNQAATNKEVGDKLDKITTGTNNIINSLTEIKGALNLKEDKEFKKRDGYK